MKLISSVFIATSLDGYIARADGSLDWLDAANTSVPEGEDCGYRSFMEAIDFLIMGRKTYEKVLSFGAWPYGNKPVIVLSRNEVHIPGNLVQTVTYSCESPQELYARLSDGGAKRLYIDGGLTIQRFLAAGLIDDITVTIIPVLLGSGISLFGNLENDIALRHVATRTYDFGFVQLTYSVEKSTIQT